MRSRDLLLLCCMQIPVSISSDVGVLLGLSFATTFMPEAADEVAVVGCCACLTYRDGHQPEWQEEAEFVKAHYPAGKIFVNRLLHQLLIQVCVLVEYS